MIETEVDVSAVVEGLDEVLRMLVGPDVDIHGDPMILVAAIEVAASGIGDRDPAEVSALLTRLDAALAGGFAAVEHLGLEVPHGR